MGRSTTDPGWAPDRARAGDRQPGPCRSAELERCVRRRQDLAQHLRELLRHRADRLIAEDVALERDRRRSCRPTGRCSASTASRPAWPRSVPGPAAPGRSRRTSGRQECCRRALPGREIPGTRRRPRYLTWRAPSAREPARRCECSGVRE